MEFDTDAAGLHRTRNRLGDHGDVEATSVLDHVKLAEMLRRVADELEVGDTAGAACIPGHLVGGVLPRVGVWALEDDARMVNIGDESDDIVCRYCGLALFPWGPYWTTVSPAKRVDRPTTLCPEATDIEVMHKPRGGA